MKANILFKEWLTIWLRDKESFVKAATYASYSTSIVNHIIPALGDLYLNQITERKLQETAFKWLENGRCDSRGGLSVKTVRDLVMLTKLSLKAAAKAGYIKSCKYDICFPRPKTAKRLSVLSKNEQMILMQYIYLNLDYRSAGVLFCLYTGVRIGEICSLQWKDIDFENKSVYVHRTVQRIYAKNTDGTKENKLITTTPKTINSIRTIPLSSAIYHVLEKLNPHNPEAYLLTGTEDFTEPRSFRSFYCRLLKNSGINYIKFHGLRHTFATRLIENGADYKTVSELLGHSSVNLTLNLYVHPQMEQKRKAVELIGYC